MKLGNMRPGMMFRSPHAPEVVMMRTTQYDRDNDTVAVVGLKHGTLSWWPRNIEIDELVSPIGQNAVAI